MAAIPALAWLIIGGMIIGISWYSDMPLFFWIGWAFVVFGIAKLIIGFVLGKKETKTEQKNSPASNAAAQGACSQILPVRVRKPCPHN
ncbi:MAG: hypothetical protein QXR48_04200 [Candidatus Woesearchaeota archaeon]